MTVQRFIAGAWRTATRKQRYIAESWRTATRKKLYKGGAWHDGPAFVSSLAASASPSSVVGIGSSPFTITITTNTATITPSGGLGPYSYSWSPSAGITATNPTSATTAFSRSVSTGQDLVGSATCTVTDSLGATTTVDVDAEHVNEG